MGCTQSNQAPGGKETAPTTTNVSSEVEEFLLKKRREGCTGMFWRADPTKKNSLENNNHWPRDGAKLKGYVAEVDGEKWLLATEVMQKGSDEWKKAPKGAAMPFEYDNHYYLE
eukprot:scaffold7316_cov123-Cylindrotheca_fusiformis.AAC.9